MSKYTPSHLVSLVNQVAAILAINNNLDEIQTALENTLSRNGTSPNSMSAVLDMNSQPIINLGVPTEISSPVRQEDLTAALVGLENNGSIYPSRGQFLTALEAMSTGAIDIVLQNIPADPKDPLNIAYTHSAFVKPTGQLANLVASVLPGVNQISLFINAMLVSE